MPDIWLVLSVGAGLLGFGALVRLITSNRSNEPSGPTSPPADAGAEGMLVTGPGDVSPGEPDQKQGSKS
jgi:hypothetical protein